MLGSFEEPREAKQWGVEIERRNWLAFRDQLVDTDGVLESGDERGLAFVNNMCTLRFKERGIANELDRIAQALLGIEEDTAAFEGFALPRRLGELTAWGFFAVPSPFVFLPASLEIAHRE